LLGDAFNARGELQLGRSLNLSVHAPDSLNDVDEPIGAGALAEEAANEPPGTDLVPGERDQ